MRSRKSTPTNMILCLAFAFICALCVHFALSQAESSAQAQRTEALSRYGGEQVEVCVATHDIEAGTKIVGSDVSTKLWIADLLPANAVTNVQDIMGKVTTESIISGEVISLNRFKGSDNSYEIPDGFCAVSVPAKDVQAVGGSIHKGMYIDLYATSTTGTALIGSNLEVLSTNNSTSSENTSSAQIAWVILAVPQSDAEVVVTAAQNASLYFVLPGENLGDDDES